MEYGFIVAVHFTVEAKTIEDAEAQAEQIKASIVIDSEAFISCPELSIQ